MDAKELLAKYEAGTCSDSEKQLLELWMLNYRAGEPSGLTPDDFKYARQLNWKAIRPVSRMKVRRWVTVAAALLVIGLSIFFWRPNNHVEQKQPSIPPGYNQATLTLADGTKVVLDSAQSGIIVSDENIKYNNGIKVEGVGGKAEGPGASGIIETRKSKIVNNILSTPKGGQYQIILEDGTKVWLNAASTLKYPSKFTGDRREVELEGEAYFFVASRSLSSSGVMSRVPFVVKSRNQSVTVLGTEFNLAAYADENAVKTTLVNGAVRITNSAGAIVSLEPNEQSIQINGQLTKTKVNVNSEIAWHTGWFNFNHTQLSKVMKQVERWYNVEVNYRSLPNKRIVGDVSRDIPLPDFLNALEAASGLKFNVAERRITVQK
ncbi:FecR family protein [bacterium A37T11]|nr:FecR family protein [bacterium A37T11]